MLTSLSLSQRIDIHNEYLETNVSGQICLVNLDLKNNKAFMDSICTYKNHENTHPRFRRLLQSDSWLAAVALQEKKTSLVIESEINL